MSMRVLVVDDTVVFRRIVSDALKGVPGVEVVGTASNGRLAMARIAALQPDLVTLDIEMPEMNGIEVLAAINAAGIKTGVIMLSSLTVRGGEMTVRALELGAFDFLTKPEGSDVAGNLGHLRTRLAAMIGAFERRREVRAILRGDALRAVPEAISPAPAAALPRPSLGRCPPIWARRYSSSSTCRPCSPSRWRPAWTKRAPFGSKRPRMGKRRSPIAPI